MRTFEWDFMPCAFTDHDGVITKQILIERFVELHHLANCFVDLSGVIIYDDGRIECLFTVTDF